MLSHFIFVWVFPQNCIFMDKSSTVALCQIYQQFGKDVHDSLIGCGCDTVSSFHGIGKKKSFATMKSIKKYQVVLSKLDEFSISEDILKTLETYVCEVYGQEDCLSVNEAHVRMFKGGKHDDLCLPLNKDSLMMYIDCANY